MLKNYVFRIAVFFHMINPLDRWRKLRGQRATIYFRGTGDPRLDTKPLGAVGSFERASCPTTIGFCLKIFEILWDKVLRYSKESTAWSFPQRASSFGGSWPPTRFGHLLISHQWILAVSSNSAAECSLRIWDISDVRYLNNLSSIQI